MPSAKLRSANVPHLRLWCDAVGDRTPASRTPNGHSNHYATRGRYYYWTGQTVVVVVIVVVVVVVVVVGGGGGGGGGEGGGGAGRRRRRIAKHMVERICTCSLIYLGFISFSRTHLFIFPASDAGRTSGFTRPKV